MSRKRRRGAGEGTVAYRPEDGRWWARLSVGWKDGKRVRKTFYGTSEAEVQGKLLDARAAIAKGLPLVTERLTVGQFLDRWLADSVKPSVRPRTYESYETTVRLHLASALGKLRLEKLTPQHLQTLLNRKSNELSARSVAYLRSVLVLALNQALRWGLIARNVATLVTPPRVVRHEITPLDAEQARALLDAASGTRLEALYTAALNLGLRRGELLGLRWQDLDFDRSQLRVVQAVQRVAGKLCAAETKTARSRRTLTLSASVVAALRAHRVRQLQERLLAGTTWQDSGLVFTSRCGTPLEPRSLLRDFVRLLKLAGVPRVRFHDLRHSCASLLLSQGMPLRLIQEILGHSSIAMTANVYSHIAPILMREAAAKMDAILG